MASIVVGSYEELILGYQLLKTDSEAGGWEFRLSFSDHSHTSSVRCLAASKSGTYVASGATDERLKLFNLADRLDLGTLADHVGSVNDVEFFDDSHLLSASDDGEFCVYSCPSWNLISKIRAHKGGILSLTIHPSGKLALTLGKDKKLKTWNLINGRCAFTVGAKIGTHTVKFSPSGQDYITVSNGSLTLFSVADCRERFQYSPATSGVTISSVLFLESHPALLIGLSDGQLITIDTSNLSETPKTIQLHNCRIKCLSQTIAEGFECLFTAGSDGCVKVWELQPILSGSTTAECLAQINCGVRITCLVACYTTKMKQEKTRKPTVEEQPKTLETENPVKRKKTDSETPDLATGKAKVQKKAEASAKKLIKKKKLKRKSKVIVDKSLE